MRDWKKVNYKYIREGYLYLSFDFLDSWEQELKVANANKEGARFKYPDSLIRFCAVLKVCFHLGFRQEQGALEALGKWAPLPAVISYAQIQRRMNALGLNIVDSLTNPADGQIVAIDSSGIKLYNSGQWIREKHKKRSPFLKLHIAVNVETKQAVSLRITEDSVGDNAVALPLIDDARKQGKVAKALLDGAYDTYDIWNGLHARNIRPLIRLRKNAVIDYGRSETRSQAIKCYFGNEKDWVKATGFGYRWHAETWYSSYKRRFGECCFSTKPENVFREILFKAMLCNQLIG
jgi:hypothetical protein